MTALLRGARRKARASRRRLASPSPARRHAPARGVAPKADEAWEVRSFGTASAAILMAFVLALAYLGSSTGVATLGYEAERLQAQRDELRRQNALLDVRLATLASPARVEMEAKRLGLVHLSFVPVVPLDPLAATR